ncbi:MAG: HEAT repeat domain-containing protein [Eubacteriales bacterium]|nr:HEAT repeat domain-containing protein [Eubacteriales bacterium]
MIIRVDRLIYVYLALCACLLLFNLAYTGRRRISDIRNPFRTKMWRAYLDKLTEEESMTDKQIKGLTRRLSHVSGLEAFQETIDMICSEGKETETWFGSVRPVFIHIGSRYLKKSVMEEAYYAYVVWQNKLCGNSEEDAIVRYMLQLICEHSIYCRENALKALYKAGSPELTVKAYKIMQRHGIDHSQKLVTDGLAGFAGNKEELAECLFREWDKFTPYYQTAFINFMRLSVDSFGERLLKLLVFPETDREVKFAVIRYLRRHKYEPAAQYLQKLVRDWKVDDWEFPALAASALENYPSQDTVHALDEAMHSTSWYVRSNASDSLLKTAGDEFVMDELLRSDKYAMEMIRYKQERRKEECRNDGCN